VHQGKERTATRGVRTGLESTQHGRDHNGVVSVRGIRGSGIGFAIAASLLAAAPARAASLRCANVEVHNKSGTEGVGAQRIRARGTTCRTARHVAEVAAHEALVRGERHVRKTIDGFHVVVQISDCAGCAPEWPATATKPGARVTFVLLGGA
jgi:hypothetical protein